nr:MAG TPA: hypothetical protein [Caudoviricetes sp.]
MPGGDILQSLNICPGSDPAAACSPTLSGWMYTRLYIMHNYSFSCIFMYYQIII